MFFARLGRWCYQHRWKVVGLWVFVAVVGGALLGAIGTRSHTEFTLPDVESKRGIDMLEEHFGGQGAGWSGTIVFLADDGVDDPAVTATMEQLFTAVAEIDNVTNVASPYTSNGGHQIARDGDLADRLAYAVVELPSNTSVEVAEVVREDILEHVPEMAGLQVELGGEVFAEFDEPQAEIVGVAFAIIILIVAFGSVLAMGLPIGVGLAGIGVGTIFAGFIGHLLEVPDFAQMIGIMIGLGVGIDYALFIITRFRENRRAGHDIEQSIVIAINTAGRAVAFAGATVVISLLGMIIMQLAFITGMAVSASVVVAVTMVASLTLLPALIGIAGHRIEVTRWRGVIAAGCVSIALLGVAFGVGGLSLIALSLAVVVMLAGLALAPLKKELPPRRHRPIEHTAAYRWSRLIQRYPWPAALTGALVLVVLALPVLGLRMGFSDEGNYAEDTSTRKAYDLLADGFGPGYNGPLLLVAEVPPTLDSAGLDAATDRVTGAVSAHPSTYFLSEANCVDAPDAIPGPCDLTATPTAVSWTLIPTTSPQDERTTDFVHDLRDDVLPSIVADTGLDVAVTGNVAISVDFTDYLSARVPYFFAAVLGLSFLLLMVVFRSILVPLKAVIMNLLGIGAAYGILVAGFQWGWLGPVLGIDGGPIEPFMPMMLFAIVFGLSMDYEVFLLSRIKEDWDRTGDSRTSVANGLAATARVITAAALIMMVVFGAFALGDNRVIKLAGVGLAVAVFLDATLIRMLLVPATMELLGDRNWWLPRWLSRILPTIDVEGHNAEGATPIETPAVDEERDADLERV